MQIVNRNAQFDFSFPLQSGASLSPVAELDSGGHEQGVVHDGVPVRETVGFEAGGREPYVLVDLASQPAFARSRPRFNDVDPDRRQRNDVLVNLRHQSLTPSSSPCCLSVGRADDRGSIFKTCRASPLISAPPMPASILARTFCARGKLDLRQ